MAHPPIDRVGLDDVRAAARLLDGVVTRTPVQPFRAMSEAAGAPVVLKCENLQRAGSFKIRGAYTRLSRMDDAEKARGVVAASAGNHAQGVALAAQMLGIHAVVYMPVGASVPKVVATRGYGAEVRQVGDSVDEALVAAREESARTGRTLIHPFDHVDVVAGQGTVALEILEQVPDVGTVVVPLGGGGLVAGIATVLAEAAPHVRVVGVQAETAAAYPASLAAGRPTSQALGATMADGIAIGTPGDVPFEVLARLGVEVRTVSEEQMSRALLLVRVVQHGLVAAGRYLQLRVCIDDKPGSLAALLEAIAATGANIVQVEHTRTDTSLTVSQVLVNVQLETKGHEHCTGVVAALSTAGYDVA